MIGERGAWADNRHVAAQDGDKLRQLVNAGGADKFSDAGNARIVVVAVNAAAGVLCVDGHGAKFQNEKLLAVQPEPLLLEQDRTFRVQLDGNGDDEEQRGQQNQCQGRKNTIYSTLAELSIHTLSPSYITYQISIA